MFYIYSMKRGHLVLYLILISCFQLAAQSHAIDSLKNVLKTESEDTGKVNTLNLLSFKLWRTGKYDTSQICAKSAQELAKKLDFQNGIAAGLNNVGMIDYYLGNYSKALELQKNALGIYQKTGNKAGIGKTLISIGGVYNEQGNFSQALENMLKALSIQQEIGNKSGMASAYTNIGLVYFNEANYTPAMDNMRKALIIQKELGDKNGIGTCLVNMGAICTDQGKLSEALEHYMEALPLYQEVGNKNAIAAVYSNMGDVRMEKGDYPQALQYYFKSLNTYHEMKAKNGIGWDLCGIAGIYTKQKNYKEAKTYLDSALDMAKEIDNKQMETAVYNMRIQFDSASGNYKAEVSDYREYLVHHDSLINQANTKKMVQEQMNYEFEQKQAAEKAEQDNKDAIAERDKNRQRIILNSFMGGFVLMLTLVFFIFRGYRQKQKANIIITQQNEEVVRQKELLEVKNKEILDSIIYAKRLQDAILPPMKLIKQFFPESFVLYKPKDIVAGDFYWMERAGDNILIAAADCTGHGVPGAMVSVVCSSALNRTVKEFHITEPGKILDKVRELVLETFEKSESNVQDGMDISLCCLNTKTNEIQWSGAYNSLWYIQNGIMHEVDADKQPIGKKEKPAPFNTHKLNLQKGDILYLLTDGYADQFGGPQGKKFKYKQLHDLLLTNANASMEKQKNILETSLEGWKGNLEQVDDVLVIGIRV